MISECAKTWILVFAMACVAVAINPLLFQDGLPIDERLTFYLPHHAYDAYWFSRGYIPAWNFYSYFGSPAIATHQFAFFYPLNRLFHALFDAILAQKISSAFHVFLAGTFTMLYLRRMRVHRAAAFLAGVVFICSGHIIAKEAHVPHHHTASWLPVLFFFIEGFLRGPNRWDFFGIAATYAMAIFAGYMHVVVLMGFAAGIYGLVYTIIRRRYVAVLLVGLAILWGGALAAVQLLPVQANLDQTVRAKIDYEAFTSDYLPLDHLPLMAFPLYFGGGIATAEVPYFGEFNLTELSCWIGYLPPVFAVFALLALRKGRRKMAVWAWAIMAALFFLLCLGPQTFVHKLAYHVPVYNLFRSAARNMLLVHFGVAVLAGSGAHALIILALRRHKAFRRATRILAASLVGIALLMLAFVYTTGHDTAGFAALAVPIGCAAAAAIAVAIWSIVRWPFFLFACLLPMVFQSVYTKPRLTIERHTREQILLHPEENEIVREMLRREGTLDNWRHYAVVHESYHGGFEYLTPSFHLVYPVRNLTGYGPLYPATLDWLFTIQITGVVDHPDKRLEENRTFSLMNVKYLTIRKRDTTYEPLLRILEDSDMYDLVYTSKRGTMLWVNRNALPRAWTVEEIITPAVGGKPSKVVRQTIRWIMNPENDFDPGKQAVYVGDAPEELPRVYTRGNVAVVQNGPNALTITVAAEEDVFVVLAEPHYPGWKAYADGKRIALHPVNGIEAGLYVPEGTREIKMKYRPKALYLGLSISVLSFILLAGAVSRKRLWRLAR